MDAGTAAVIAAAITGTVALVATATGQVVGYLLTKRDARSARVRQLRLDQLAQAERSLVLQLDLSAAIADRNLSLGLRLVEELRTVGYANALLVGDLDAAKGWAAACATVMSRLPRHRLRGMQVWILGVKVSPSEKAALFSAKSAVLAAFDSQRERVVADRPLAALDITKMTAEIERMAEVQALMARFGQAEPQPTP
jgi:hypothetical protein